MASRFFHVQHEFRAGTSQKWFETVQKALAPGGGWDEAVARNLEAGFFNHSFNIWILNTEMEHACFFEVKLSKWFCIFELKEFNSDSITCYHVSNFK